VSQTDSNDLWTHRRAAPVRQGDRLVLIALFAAGLLSCVLLAEWWFRADHVGSVPLFVLLSLAFWYGIGRMIAAWVNYLAIARAPHAPAPPGLRVAIFTTSSPGEPLAMFEKTLAACARLDYPHVTYLLDDTRDPRVRDLAARHGAVHLELVGLPGAKAGKINRALALTDEDFVLVLDPDHVPFPPFLDRVLGQFRDPRVGFVQVSQAYYNQRRSFTAAGAAEQTYGFYGPHQMGLYGHGGAVAIGANCTFRRAALESIGGHGIGLAEDLVTSIRLHAAGWRSVYVPEVLSRGLVPEDLGTFYRQQVKWTRGVFEVLFAELPRLFRQLTWRQRFSYATLSTYYLSGLTTLAYLVIPYLYLWTGHQPARMRFEEFVTTALPVAAFGTVTYLFVQRWLCHPDMERGLHWRGLALKMACWPVFVAGTLLAVARAEVPYVPTRKQAVGGRFLRLAWPHLLVVCAFAVTLGRVVHDRVFRTSEGALMLTSEAVWAMIGFALVSASFATGALYAAWDSRRHPGTAAWDAVDVNRLDSRVQQDEEAVSADRLAAGAR
jgi:cellulose synthase (UDP-forming)